MSYLENSKFYFNIWFQNITIFSMLYLKHQYFYGLFQNIQFFNIFIKKHQNLVSIFYSKASKIYFNVLFRNTRLYLTILFPPHRINRSVFSRKGAGGSQGSPCRPGTSFTLKTPFFPVPVIFTNNFYSSSSQY
jgi:hypothetical protein